MEGRFLGKEQVRPVQGQVPINLIRGNLMIAFYAVFPAGVHEHRRAHDIGFQENSGVFDGTVHMALRRKVHHHVRVLFLKEFTDRLSVPDIFLHEAEVRGLQHLFQGA